MVAREFFRALGSFSQLIVAVAGSVVDDLFVRHEDGKPIVADEISAINPNGQGISAEEIPYPSGPLRVYMEMRLV